jgi:hypothetical protein
MIVTPAQAHARQLNKHDCRSRRAGHRARRLWSARWLALRYDNKPPNYEPWERPLLASRFGGASREKISSRRRKSRLESDSTELAEVRSHHKNDA